MTSPAAPTVDPAADPVDRAFIRVDDALVHLRRTAGDPARHPLVMLHASPGSSRALAPLMRALHASGGAPTLIAPDTAGNGDSDAPAEDAPDIAWFAAALVRLLDRLELDSVDLYGTHTGARIACEAAAAYPDRIKRVIFDGIGDYPPEMRAMLVRDYAPEMRPDDYGTHFLWAFNFVRDQALHFPHFLRDPAHRLTTRPVPSAEDLHAATLDVLKGLASYHKPYRAAFSYEAGERMGDIPNPAVLLSVANELPNLRTATEALAARLPDGAVLTVGPTLAEKADAIRHWLDRTDAAIA